MPNVLQKAESVEKLTALTGAFALRADALCVLRSYFKQSGFIEVATPIAIRAPAAEEYIEAPKTQDGLYLRSSPELEMKRLLAAGMERIYELGPCFRRGEFGRTHRPEFDMLEWYMAHSDYMDMLEFTKGLVRAIAAELNVPREILDPFAEWKIIGVREAFRDFAGEDADLCAETEGLFETVLVEKVEPALPHGVPCVLMDYPVRFGAFARQKPSDPGLVERWEVYMNGVEIANAYGELIDPEEQIARFARFNRKRVECGYEAYPEPVEFLEAIRSGIPASSGCALGFDRLMMVLTGKHDLAEVMYPV